MARGKRCRKSISDNNNRFHARYGHMIEKSTIGKNKSNQELPKPLHEMVPGDGFQCGTSVSFSTAIKKQIRLVCFDCPRMFRTVENKIKHMLKKHNYNKNSKICSTCLSLTKTPGSHFHQIEREMSSIMNNEASSSMAEASNVEQEEEDELDTREDAEYHNDDSDDGAEDV